MKETQKINKPEDLLSGVPTIGGQEVRDKQLIKDAIDEFCKVLDPIMNRMGGAVSEIQQRVTQLEEILNGAFVEVMTERVREKLNLKNPTFESVMIGGKGIPETKKTKEAKE